LVVAVELDQLLLVLEPMDVEVVEVLVVDTLQLLT
jgi:hypothetical protein